MKQNSSVDNFLEKLTSAIKERDLEKEKEAHQKKLAENSALIPKKILDGIWEENTDFLLGKYVFNNDYFIFIWGILNLEAENESILEIIRFGTRFMIQVFARSRDKPMFAVWVAHFQKVFSNSTLASQWLFRMLTTNVSFIKQMFLHCPLEKIRLSFVQIIQSAFHSLAESNDPSAYEFIHTMLSPNLLKSVRRNSRFCAQYFLVIGKFAQIGDEQRNYLISKGYIAKLIDFCIGNSDYMSLNKSGLTASDKLPLASSTPSGKITPQNIFYLVELLQLLVCSCRPQDAPSDLKSPVQTEGKVFDLHELDQERLFDKNFFSKIIREAVNIEATAKMAIHLCWDNKNASKFFINLVKEGISKGTADQFKPFFKILTALLSVKDSIQVWRIDTALYAHLKVIESNVFRKDTSDRHVKYLMKLANKNEEVKMWLFKHKEILNDVLEEAGYRVM
eukprot:TRINITY_DN11925_c0_g1_i1.p1 TRINITY_DN11925_c0_g1~~TRINITY_DN11925_c0_g1_i1.p1  ORF type:complete len:471 (+),score=137.56 TRINITY_DN11925_c0_g1_i1:68-1414(+)